MNRIVAQDANISIGFLVSISQKNKYGPVINRQLITKGRLGLLITVIIEGLISYFLAGFQLEHSSTQSL